MRHAYLSILLLLVAIYPAEAGRYDDPSFLTSHLVSGGATQRRHSGPDKPHLSWHRTK